MSSLHVVFPESIKIKLKEYAAARRQSMGSLVNHAVSLMFTLETPNIEQTDNLQEAIERRFSIPSIYSVRAFYTTLFLNADKYPKSSAKVYWGPLVYLSEVDKTNQEILIEIKEDVKRARTNGSTKEGKFTPTNSKRT